MQRFHVQNFKAELGLALYVLGKVETTSQYDVCFVADNVTPGYGIGPLIFAPLSEGPSFQCLNFKLRTCC